LIIVWFGVGLAVISLIVMMATINSIGEEWMVMSLVGLLVGIILMIAGMVISEEENKNACKNVGGEYVVVDTQMTVVSTGKVTTASEVDIYGCVKE
jgi:hypothetical protein